MSATSALPAAITAALLVATLPLAVRAPGTVLPFAAVAAIFWAAVAFRGRGLAAFAAAALATADVAALIFVLVDGSG